MGKAAHASRTPFINPVPRLRWAYGDSLPAGALDQAYAEQAAFKAWFNTHILPPASAATTITANGSNDNDNDNANTKHSPTCSSALILYPASKGEPIPRDDYFGPADPPVGFGHPARISSLAGVPDSVLPVGEARTLSRITGWEEPLPVAVDVVAAAGCDGLLARLAQELVEAGVLAVPKTGASLEEGGGVLM